MEKARRQAPFFGLQDSVPIVLALLLGCQYALAMLADVSGLTCLFCCGVGGNEDEQSWRQFFFSNATNF